MRRTLVAAAAVGAIAAVSAAAALGAARTTAPDATINLRLIVTDSSAKFAGKAEWSKLMQLPRGTYGRVIIVNNGTQTHTFALSRLAKSPRATIKPGKKAIIVADFLARGDFPWAVDAGSTGAGIFRIF